MAPTLSCGARRGRVGTWDSRRCRKPAGLGRDSQPGHHNQEGDRGQSQPPRTVCLAQSGQKAV